jgi:hypothetical protein
MFFVIAGFSAAVVYVAGLRRRAETSLLHGWRTIGYITILTALNFAAGWFVCQALAALPDAGGYFNTLIGQVTAGGGVVTLLKADALNRKVGSVYIGPGLFYFAVAGLVEEPLFTELEYRRQHRCEKIASRARELGYKPNAVAKRMSALISDQWLPEGRREERIGQVRGALDRRDRQGQMLRLIHLMDRWHMRGLLRDMKKGRPL